MSIINGFRLQMHGYVNISHEHYYQISTLLSNIDTTIRVQVVLSGFSVRLFSFVQTKTFCRYGCIYFLAALVLVCVDVMVMSSA